MPSRSGSLNETSRQRLCVAFSLKSDPAAANSSDASCTNSDSAMSCLRDSRESCSTLDLSKTSRPDSRSSRWLSRQPGSSSDGPLIAGLPQVRVMREAGHRLIAWEFARDRESQRRRFCDSSHEAPPNDRTRSGGGRSGWHGGGLARVRSANPGIHCANYG